MNCPSCNAQVPQDATACPGCGAPITPAAATASPAAAPQDAQKKAGFDIKAVSSQLSTNPVVKKYGVFIAAGVVVLLVLIICLIACSGGNGDNELILGSAARGMAQTYERMDYKNDAKRLNEKAFKYLKQSAKAGNVEGMIELAEFYKEEKEDDDAALKWAKKAEKKGSKRAKELIERWDGGKKKSKKDDDD